MEYKKVNHRGLHIRAMVFVNIFRKWTMDNGAGLSLLLALKDIHVRTCGFTGLSMFIDCVAAKSGNL